MPKPRNLNPTEVAFRLAEIPGVAHNHRKVHGESPGMSSVPLGMRIEKVPQQAGLVCATAKGYWTPLLLPWPQSGGHNTRHQDGQACCTRPCAWHSYQLPTRSAKAWSADTCSIIRSCSHAPIAQWLEHWSYEPRVMGSNPIGGTIPCWSIRALLLGSPPPHIHSGLRGLGCRTLPKGHHTNSSQRLENGAAAPPCLLPFLSKQAYKHTGPP